MPIYDFDSPTVHPRPARRFRLRTLGFLAVPVLLFSTLSGFWSGPNIPPGSEATIPDSETSEVLPEVSVIPIDTIEVDPGPGYTEIAGRILRRESFSDALRREGLSSTNIFELVSAVRRGVHRAEFNPNIVQRGDRYRLEIDSLGAVQTFEYVKKGALENRFVAQRETGVLKAWKEQVVLERRVVIVSGEIRDMLWNALTSTGENPAILSAHMTDIFEYYIDFMVDCRVGDRFSLAVEKFYKDDQFVRYGDIISAEYRAARDNYQAFLFETPDGDAGYYDAEGKSLRGLFLKSPLNFRRISSGYTNRRYHPILKKYIPHHGIDYAADYGTPVWATAAGTVVFKGRKGALGNYVEIRHKNGYKTGYGHLSRYHKKLKNGAFVKQKEIIGYVGATGRATGPHLHYNFFARTGSGGYRTTNPSVVSRPTGKPVPASVRANFLATRDRL
ncbi:MAG: M23 family metallopeptidase, partial [bacterium]|nr:M23 family metallopeptidase [bacterium]